MDIKDKILKVLERYNEDLIIEINKVVHDEGDSSHCDTGEDMEWACRSQCTKEILQKVRTIIRSGL